MSDGDGTAALYYGNTTSVRAWAELHMNSYLHAVGIQFPDEIKSRDWTEVTMTWRKEGY